LRPYFNGAYRIDAGALVMLDKPSQDLALSNWRCIQARKARSDQIVKGASRRYPECGARF
jgi:hypothetical protein